MDPTLRVRPAGAWRRLVLNRYDADMNLDNPFLLRLFPAVGRVVGSSSPTSTGCASILSLQRKGPHERVGAPPCCVSIPSQSRGEVAGRPYVPKLAIGRGGNPNRTGFDSHLPSSWTFPCAMRLAPRCPPDSLRWGEDDSWSTTPCPTTSHLTRLYRALMIFAGNQRHRARWPTCVARRRSAGPKSAMTLCWPTCATYLRSSAATSCCSVRDLSQGHGGTARRLPAAGPAMRSTCRPCTAQGAAPSLTSTRAGCSYAARPKPSSIQGGRSISPRADRLLPISVTHDYRSVFVFVNNSPRRRKRVPWSHYAEIAQSLSVQGCDVLTESRSR